MAKGPKNKSSKELSEMKNKQSEVFTLDDTEEINPDDFDSADELKNLKKNQGTLSQVKDTEELNPDDFE